MPAGSLHLTLVFLGERPDADAPALGRAVAACAASVPGLSLGEPVWLPPRRPAVLAVDVVDGEGACATLQAALVASLAGGGLLGPERRRFRPHVTVARVRRGARVDRRAVPGRPDAGSFAGLALTLYRSVLGAPGARYEPLERIALGP